MDKRRILAAALTAVMLLGMLPAALAAEPQPTEAADELGITLLKTAGALNSVRETKISLEISAPVNETPVAVEFVMDATSSLFSSGDEIMIQSWAEEIRGAMADKNVYAGLTVFANDAKTVYEMSQLTAESTFDYSLGEEMLWLAGHTGTNLQAGIRAGLADLEKAPDTVPQANRYLVLITDGGSFWWLDDAGNPANDTYNDGTRLQNNDAAEGGYESLTDLTDLLGQTVSAQPAAYTSAGDEALADVVSQIKTSGALTNFEKGVHFAAKELDKVTEAGVRLITVRYPYYADEEGLSALTALAGQLMDYAERKSVFTASPASLEETAAELESVMDQIYGGGVNVVVPAGSTITDVIGKDEDYDFDLSIKSKEIPALADFALKIGGDAPMEGQLDENNQITFADGSTLTYYPEAEGQDERFVLTLGQDIHRSERVSLTYTARLAERDTSRGEHYVYPNVEAYLTLSDTDESYLFPRPRLGYTISGGGSSDGGGDTVIDENDTPLGPLPELNIADHFAYIIGRDDGLVHPEASITRAEVATIFFRMLTEDSRAQLWTTTNPYSDVAAEAWYNNAVSTLTTSGVITGKPGNVFDPDAPITRAEFATIAVRFFGGSYEGEDQFTDIAGHWANKYINRAAVLGLINGKGDGTFDPNADITRAEAMAIVNRTLGRKPDADHMLPNMITWEDNLDESKWYYTDVQEATNSHDFEVESDADGLYEVWTGLLQVRDWAALEREWSESNSSSNPGDVVSDVVTEPEAGEGTDADGGQIETET